MKCSICKDESNSLINGHCFECHYEWQMMRDSDREYDEPYWEE
jgi:hypothetical protein